MSQKLEILLSIEEHAEPRSLSYEGEHVTTSECERSILEHTKLFKIKSINSPKSSTSLLVVVLRDKSNLSNCLLYRDLLKRVVEKESDNA